MLPSPPIPTLIPPAQTVRQRLYLVRLEARLLTRLLRLAEARADALPLLPGRVEPVSTPVRKASQATGEENFPTRQATCAAKMPQRARTRPPDPAGADGEGRRSARIAENPPRFGGRVPADGGE